MQRVGLSGSPRAWVARRLPRPLALFRRSRSRRRGPGAARRRASAPGPSRPPSRGRLSAAPFRQLLASRAELDQLIQRVRSPLHRGLRGSWWRRVPGRLSSSPAARGRLVILAIIIVRLRCHLAVAHRDRPGRVLQLPLPRGHLLQGPPDHAGARHAPGDRRHRRGDRDARRALPADAARSSCRSTREAAIARLGCAASRAGLPCTRLDVKLLCGGRPGDGQPGSRRCSCRALPPVVVPDSQPETKPRPATTGSSSPPASSPVIFDAEDRPGPTSSKAVIAFTGCTNVVCVRPSSTTSARTRTCAAAADRGSTRYAETILPAMGGLAL